MDGPTMLEENMDKVNITTEELHARLREANVAQLSQVKAVDYGNHRRPKCRSS